MNVIKNNLFNLEENYFTAFYDLITKPSIVKVDPECYNHEIFNNFNKARLELMIRRINDYITLAGSDSILHDVELIKFTRVSIYYVDFKTGFKITLYVDVQYGPNSLDHKSFSLYPEDFKDETVITEYDILLYILKDSINYTDRVLLNVIISIITDDFNFITLEKYISEEKIKIIVDKVNNDFKPIINPNDYDFKYLVWNDREKFKIIVHDTLKVFFGIIQFMKWEELGDDYIEEWYNVDYQLPSIDPYHAKDFVIAVSYNYTYTFSIDQMLKYGNINNLLTYMISTIAYKLLSVNKISPDRLTLGYMWHYISMYDVSVISSVMLGDCSGNQVVDKTEETYEPAE